MYRNSYLFIITVGMLMGLICLPGRAVQAETLSLEQIAQGLQGTYEKTADFKARFVQEVTLASVNRKEREEGTVYYKPPQKMLWDYTKPKVKKLIINPTKAYLYVPQDQAVYVQDTPKLFKSQILVRLLDGLGKVTEDFNLTFVNAKEPTDEGGHYLLYLTPKKGDLGVDRIQVTIHKADFTIIQCQFSDVYGNRTAVSFRNIVINSNLPDKLFQFKPPPKVEIYPMP
jgi:outer membrane lipoprotein carrier protein